MKRRTVLVSIIIIVVLVVVAGGVIATLLLSNRDSTPPSFNADRSYADVKYQVDLGPRIPGSQPHAQAVQWIVTTLKQYGWQVDLQETQLMNQPIQNIIAKKGSGNKPWRIIGAHYDSRMLADQDPNPANRTKPVPGANDGASGVAVLLELARDLNFNLANEQVWLVFFDSEDQGDIPGWDWILGSQAFVDQLNGVPDAVVVIDMIGDSNLDIYKEKNSNVALTDAIWQIATDLGYQQQFIHQYKYSMEDDHTPFLQKGMPAIDIIDFDYPYCHTISDTTDKVSTTSLKVVGDTLLKWIITP